MLLAQWPLSVLMQRRLLGSRWPQLRWSALAVLPADRDGARTLPAAADLTDLTDLTDVGQTLHELTPGLVLELHSDELEGYFENWIAPAPKVFVSWRMQTQQALERAVPVQLSVSYAEGARMLDGGDGADGVAMPRDVHAWLGACLAQHRVAKRHKPGRGA